MRQATPDEIRKALGHGRGSRRVYVGQDGRVLFTGSIYRRRRDAGEACGAWHEACRVDQFFVFDGVAGVVMR